MEEAKACGTRQPVVIAGDLNAHPVVIPAATTALKWTVCGLGEGLCFGKGESPFRSLSHWSLESCIGGPILMWMLILRGGPVR